MSDYTTIKKALELSDLSYLEYIFTASQVTDAMVENLTQSEMSEIFPNTTEQLKFLTNFRSLYAEVDFVNKSTQTEASHKLERKKRLMSEKTKTRLKNAAIIGVVTGATAGIAVVAAPIVIGLAGFGVSGVIGGSLAAAWQASIGNVIAGSLFASLQSAGTVGLSIGASAAVGATAGTVGGAATAGVISLTSDKNNENDKGTQPDSDAM